MTLKERIQADAQKALKEQKTKTLSALRLLLSELHKVEIKKQEELDDEDVIQVVAKQARKWEEAAREYEKAGQEERAVKERGDAEVLKAYGVDELSFGREYIIPKPLDERLRDVVSKAVYDAAVASGASRL